MTEFINVYNIMKLINHESGLDCAIKLEIGNEIKF